MHFKEDLSKPENRINLALFHLLMVPEIDEYIKTKFHLPRESCIYPSANLIIDNLKTSNRPDFEVICSGKKIGYIEVELGSENKEQLNNYRKQPLPVYSIVGKNYYNQGNLTLQDIYNFVQTIKENYDHTQTRLSINLLENLIKYYVIEGNFNENKRTQISSSMRETIIIKELFNYFGTENIIEAASPQPGKILLDTVSEGGFSIRVYSSVASNKSLSLMNRRSGQSMISLQQ